MIDFKLVFFLWWLFWSKIGFHFIHLTSEELFFTVEHDYRIKLSISIFSVFNTIN